MASYEMVREIFNSCDNSKSRDTVIKEIETDDLETYVKGYAIGKEVSVEKMDCAGGGIKYTIDTDGMVTALTFTEIE